MSYVMSSGDQSVDDYDISALTAVLQSMGLETDHMTDVEKISAYHNLTGEYDNSDMIDNDLDSAGDSAVDAADQTSHRTVDANDLRAEDESNASREYVPIPAPIEQSGGASIVSEARASSAGMSELMRYKAAYVKDTLSISDSAAERLLRASDWDELRAVARYFEEGVPEQSGLSTSESFVADESVYRESDAMHPELPVRAPDSTRRERLIGGSNSSSHATAASGGSALTHMTSDFLRERTAEMQRKVEASEPGVSWMFTLPPDYPASPLLLHEARLEAVRAQKWLLVHIQCSDSLQYHHMNRDLWPQDTVLEVLRSGYVFWARGSRSVAGAAFLRLYGLGAVDSAVAAAALFPAIFVIDPRTGALIKALKNRTSMDAPELASFLMDFSDSHSTSAWAHAPAIPPSPPAVATENTTALPPTGGSNGLAKAPVSCTEPILPRRTRADYGPVTPENKDEPGVLKLGFKMSNGKSLMRFFRGSDPIRALYAFALDTEAAGDPSVVDVELATVDGHGRHVVPCFSSSRDNAPDARATESDTIASRNLVGSRVIVTAIRR